MYNYDPLFISLVRHLEYLEHILLVSKKIEIAAINQDFKTLELLVDNRERLFSIAERSQTNIEKNIVILGPVSPELKDILLTWSHDISLLIKQADQINITITKMLEKERENLTKEIATIFNIRQAHEGYNLSSVRK